MTRLTRRVAGKNIYIANLIRRATTSYIRFAFGWAQRRENRHSEGNAVAAEEKYLDSISRPDISILRAHKAPLEGDAQMTNRSANNKSRRRHSAWDSEGRQERRSRGRRARFTRKVDKILNIPHALRVFRQPAKSERSGRNISFGILISA